MAQQHEQVTKQQEQIDDCKCPYCGDIFNSGKELREHTCTMDRTEPAKQLVQSNR